MRYVPDQAASLWIRDQFYRRHPIEPALWTREADEAETNMPVQFTTVEVQEYGGTVYFYDDKGARLL